MTRPLDVIGCEVFQPCRAIQRHARDEPRLGETERRAESGDGSTVVCVENSKISARHTFYDLSGIQRGTALSGDAAWRSGAAFSLQSTNEISEMCNGFRFAIFGGSAEFQFGLSRMIVDAGPSDRPPSPIPAPASCA
jgi:hypothetical protein